MTTIPHAEPRPSAVHGPASPASSAGPAPGFHGTKSDTKIEAGFFSSQEDQGIDDRPTKRRKLSADGTQAVGGAAAGQKPSSKINLVDDFRVLAAALYSLSRRGESQDTPGLPPLPKRPWQMLTSRVQDDDQQPSHRARDLVPVPNTPDTNQFSGTPPQSSHGTLAYFPWRGKHPEDSLTAEKVKSGFYDRPPNPQERETNTARVPLYNALKHRAGLENLSTLFASLVEAKKNHGLISSASSFKPPPRVTLAEGKRKSWITDLADSHVPLRKLSRTIPQGIRGQGLLDQCLLSNVPLSRAIWFAKCVGANEIRSLKRKGTTPQTAVGSESKWLRDWTINVEQFIEGVLTQVGQPTWRTNIQYALRLATRLYLENLLDRDHYSDWIVKSFAASSDEHLPFWLMVVQTHKRDITRFRKQGKLLAEALVARYSHLKPCTVGMTPTLVKKLEDVIKEIATHRSHCFLLPDQWPSVREGLASCLEITNPQEAAVFQRLDRINERCMGSNKRSYLSKPSPQDRLLELLDAAKPPYDVESLSRDLLSSGSETELLINSCLEWATTKFRCGSTRIFLTARLLRRWQRKGVDIAAPINRFLTCLFQSSAKRDWEAVKQLSFILARSPTFSLSKYLQWLNVRGLPGSDTIQTSIITMPNGQSLVRQSFADNAQVLMDISSAQTSGHILNFRNALLHRAGYDSLAAEDATQKLLGHLQEVLSNLENSLQVESSQRKATTSLFSGWNWDIRGKISHWLRSYVAEAISQQVPKDPRRPFGSKISPGQFDLIRAVLETLNDDAVLADIVSLSSSFDDEQLQAMMVETITRHADTFSAIGALEPLQTRYSQVYMSLRSVKLTMPLFVTALLDLCMTYPNKHAPARMLQQDLIRGDRGRALAACSPFSDGIAESLQQAETTFVDDFEAVLQSEPSMHEETMNRLFALLTDRIEKQQGTIVGEHALHNYCQLMARLRLCRRSQGDRLLKEWLVKALSKYAATFTKTLVYSLVGTGCLSMDVLLDTIHAVGISTVVAHHRWLIDPNQGSDHPCAYSTMTKWKDFGLRRPQEALSLLGHAGDSDHDLLERSFATSFVLSASQDIKVLSESGRKVLNQALTSMLGYGNSSNTRITDILEDLDSLSLRFVQARLLVLQNNNTKEEAIAAANAFVDAACQARVGSEKRKQVATLLDTTSESIVVEVRHVIEERILEALPRLSDGKNVEMPFVDAVSVERLELAVKQAYELCPKRSTASPRSVQRVVEALSHLLRYLDNCTSSSAAPTTLPITSPPAGSQQVPHGSVSQVHQSSSPRDTSFRFASGMTFDHFNLLLQLLCLERPGKTGGAIDPPLPIPPKRSSDTIKSLVYLVSITTHPAMTVLAARDPASTSRWKEISDFAYDVMATYMDELGDEGRVLLAKILRDKLKDGANSRLKWLLGSIHVCGSDMPGGEELGKGLILVKRDADGLGNVKVLGEWRPKMWEVLETGDKGDTDVSVGLGLFDARRT